MLEEHGCVFVTLQSPDDESLPPGLLPPGAERRFRCAALVGQPSPGGEPSVRGHSASQPLAMKAPQR
jgi:hypothetical protein